MATTMTRMWMPSTDADYGTLVGKDVFSADGEKVGTVKAVYYPEGDFPATTGQHYFLLDPGLLREWFGGFDKVYLPESAIRNVTPDRVEVDFTKDQIKQQGWTAEPAGFARYRRF